MSVLQRRFATRIKGLQALLFMSSPIRQSRAGDQADDGAAPFQQRRSRGKPRRRHWWCTFPALVPARSAACEEAAYALYSVMPTKVRYPSATSGPSSLQARGMRAAVRRAIRKPGAAPAHPGQRQHRHRGDVGFPLIDPFALLAEDHPQAGIDQSVKQCGTIKERPAHRVLALWSALSLCGPAWHT